jgi:hypothetical protein
MSDGRYYTFTNDSRKYVSVTTFLGVIGKQQFLMPWAAKMERELISRLVEQGKALQEVLEYLQPGQPYGYQLSMQVSSAWGSKLHKAIDYTLKDLKLPKLSKTERKVYDKWLEWWKAQNYSLMAAEKVVKSEIHGYAGTLDSQVELGRSHSLILDWKTGKNHYKDHEYQNYAYQEALREQHETVTCEGLLVYIPQDKEIWTVPVPQVTSELMKPVLAALDLWREVNGKPAWEDK